MKHLPSTGFVIGNARDREEFDLETLPKDALKIGCNLIYTTYDPDIVVSVDPQLMPGVLKCWPGESWVIEREPNNYHMKNNRGKPDLPLRLSRHWDSGLAAMEVAIHLGIRTIIMIGFTFGRKPNELHRQRARTSQSMYANTVAERKEGWDLIWNEFFERHIEENDVSFIRVGTGVGDPFYDLLKPNVTFISYDELRGMLVRWPEVNTNSH